MSIHIPGKLVVQVRNGARGAFSVGDLLTSIGSFKVKDQFLDQFAEGVYEGECVAAAIYAPCYPYRGSVTTEIRAKIVDYVLATAEEKAVVREAEFDPIDQGATSTVIEPPVVVVVPEPRSTDKECDVSDAKEQSEESPKSPTSVLHALFDAEAIAAISIGDSIKLDPTIDRQKFRDQRDYLKASGYRFDSPSQAWSKTLE